MTRNDTEPLPDPREEEVRRRLADARHVEPVPVDVATRLDRVLAQLAEGEDVASSVDELAVRRRRRAAGLLAAAAAVTVVGLGLSQVLPGVGDGESSSSSAGAAESADRDAVGGSTLADGEVEEHAGAGAGAAVPGSGTDDHAAGEADGEASASAVAPEGDAVSAFVVPAGRPVRVRSERFAADALRAREVVDGSRSLDRRTESGGRRAPRGKQDLAFFECTPADWGPGVPVPVLYDDEPHVLVFRAPAGDSQVAELLQCGTGEILRSTTLPAG